MQKISPFLWFDNNAEEAVDFYCSIFKNSRVLNMSRYGDAVPGPKGTILSVEFELDGQKFTALNGGPQFKFTEAVSFVVNCETQEEIDYFWEKLSAGGAESQCGWLKDKYGLSWQVVPANIGEWIGGDPERSNRVMQEVLKMKKLEIEPLKRAYEGRG
jgi:predicted 3-demethylubiquinone-9 3-methyltransferase (glyoxalase superfamily)